MTCTAVERLDVVQVSHWKLAEMIGDAKCNTRSSWTLHIMCVCVCVCVYVCVCACACMRVRMCVCVCVCMCVCTCVCMYLCVYIIMCAYVNLRGNELELFYLSSQSDSMLSGSSPDIFL